MSIAVEQVVSRAKKAMADNQPDLAISMCEEFLQTQPDAVVLWDVLANAHFLKKDNGQAAICFEKVVELAPQNPKSHQNLGVFYQSIGKFNDALQCYQRAASCDANYAPAYNGAGIVLMSWAA